MKDIYDDVESKEINALNTYYELLDNKAKKAEKLKFITENKTIQWTAMDANKDGTYSKTVINKRLAKLQAEFSFPEDSVESQLVNAASLLTEEKEIKAKVKKEKEKMHLLTKDTIENLKESQVYDLLEHKWVMPIVNSMNNLPRAILETLSEKLQSLSDKYATTYSEVAKDINDAENSLGDLLNDLTGSEFDMKALKEFKNLLKTES